MSFVGTEHLSLGIVNPSKEDLFRLTVMIYTYTSHFVVRFEAIAIS